MNQRNDNAGTMAAIVHGDRQNLNRVYESDQALRQGTLFPELDKPMCSACTSDTCVTWEQATDFAAWEVRLYLDTHPCDRSAQALYRHYCQDRDGCGYACLCDCGGEEDGGRCGCGRDRSDRCEHWCWTERPWPWEFCEAEEGQCHVRV